MCSYDVSARYIPFTISHIHIIANENRHNASGLKEIAIEFILRNLNDPLVVAGLSVSISTHTIATTTCPFSV